MSDIDITIGNARVLLYGEIPEGQQSDRNKVGASAELFRPDDVLHAVSRMMSCIVDQEANDILQAELTYCREVIRVQATGKCSWTCEPGESPGMVVHDGGATCVRYWLRRGRQYSDATAT